MTTAPHTTAIPQIAREPIIVARRVRPRRAPDLRPYVLVLLVALGLRAAWAGLVPVALVSDCYAYDVFARNLAKGLAYSFDGVTPSAFWPVGTSFMYSLVYRLFDPQSWGYAPVLVLNTILGVAMIAAAMALSHRWFGRTVAITTGAILALWPTHIQFTTVTASETLFTLLCLSAMLAWPEPRARGAIAKAILAGLLLAAATYVRPTALLLPVVLAGSAWLRGQRPHTAVLHAAIVAAVMVIAIAPWAARNTRIYGQTVLISTNGGSNLWMGNNPETTGHYQELPPRPEHLNDAQFDKELGRRARAYILQNPGAFIVRTLVKAVRLHERETIGIRWNEQALTAMIGDKAVSLLKIPNQIYWLAALSGGIVGVGILTRRHHVRAVFHPALAMWGYFTAVHAVIVIQDRYHLPATPMIAGLAAVALVAAWDSWRSRKEVEPAP
jgi:hypothetical protein